MNDNSNVVNICFNSHDIQLLHFQLLSGALYAMFDIIMAFSLYKCSTLTLKLRPEMIVPSLNVSKCFSPFFKQIDNGNHNIQKAETRRWIMNLKLQTLSKMFCPLCDEQKTTTLKHLNNI
jgi:hypothetical protein